MQVRSNTRRLARALNPTFPPLLNDLTSSPEIFQSLIAASPPPPPRQWHFLSSFSSRYPLSFSEIAREKYLPILQNVMTTSKAYLSTQAAAPAESNPTDAVKELYDKILESLNAKRTMSPNAWLWSLINSCQNRDDIKLLFDALQNLRRFRLSNLRIHDNFNCHLCQEIVKACIRVGAIDFGKKALWIHNVYGLTPTIGSANHLLSHAEDQKDAKLLVEVMKLMKSNSIALQPSTADIVFSWELMAKYSKRFIRDQVKLRKFAFGLWMDFAAKRGNTKSLWKIEKLQSESIKRHSILSGFACAKGLILERKPEDAAVVIQALNQNLPDTRKSGIVDELQKLVSQWPLDVVKYHEGENKKALVAALKSDIPIMVASLLNMGLEAKVNLEDLALKEIPC